MTHKFQHRTHCLHHTHTHTVSTHTMQIIPEIHCCDSHILFHFSSNVIHFLPSSVFIAADAAAPAVVVRRPSSSYYYNYRFSYRLQHRRSRPKTNFGHFSGCRQRCNSDTFHFSLNVLNFYSFLLLLNENEIKSKKPAEKKRQ